MDKIINVIKYFFSRESSDRSVSYVISRIAIGIFFFITGFNKLFTPAFQDSMLNTITNIGFPYPQFTANFAAFGEVSLGLLLALGLYTRFAGTGLSLILFVALFTHDLYTLPTGLDPFTWYTYFLFLPQILYILFMFMAIEKGGGRFSIDTYFSNKKIKA